MLLLPAQTIVRGMPLLSWDQFVEEYLESRGVDEDSPSPIDRGGTTLDFLQDQPLHPLNINLATRQQLLDLSLLSAAQVDSLLAYRSHLRAFSSPSDLMMVHGIEAQQLRWLSLFVEVGDTLRATTVAGSTPHPRISRSVAPSAFAFVGWQSSTTRR